MQLSAAQAILSSSAKGREDIDIILHLKKCLDGFLLQLHNAFISFNYRELVISIK